MATRLTVAAYFHFDGQQRPDSLGSPVITDWNWAMQQFDRVAAAGAAVRSVVVEQSYVWGMPDPANPNPNTPNAKDVRVKLQNCRAAGQIVYGYVACSGGAIPLQPAATPPSPHQTWWQIPRDRTKWFVPLNGNVVPTAPAAYPATNGAYPSLREQIDTWYTLYPNEIDGIYIDEAPVDCLNAQTAQYGAAIAQNWVDYCQDIHGHKRPGSNAQALVYVLDAGYADVDPNKPGWFSSLPFDDVAVWEQGVDHYRRFWAGFDPCDLSSSEPASVPSPQWWDGRPNNAAHRIHIINDGVLAEAYATGNSWAQVVASLIALAASRGAETVWITETRTSAHGSVYGFLPPYWDSEVALCTPPPKFP